MGDDIIVEYVVVESREARCCVRSEVFKMFDVDFVWTERVVVFAVLDGVGDHVVGNINPDSGEVTDLSVDDTVPFVA